MKKKLVSLFLALCLFMSLLPAPVLAAGETVTLDIGDGSIVITSTGYSVNDGAETAHTGAYVLTGASETNTVTVAGGSHDITLQDLNIPLSSSGTAPFTIQAGASASLTLKGENTLGAGVWEEYTALRLPKGASLTITAESTGSLKAEGHQRGAGIGGSFGEDAGDVTIHGGTIYASGEIGAGIGGGGCEDNGMTPGSGGHVVVTGGCVTATSWRGAGIGGGGDNNETTGGAAGTVEISGGTVYAQGNPGIGSTNFATEGGTVSITGGFVEARGLEGGVPIGTGTGSTAEVSVSAENCVLVENDTGTVYGSAALPHDYSVLTGMTLTIPAGAALTVPESVTLSSAGTIQNNGTLTGTGTVRGVVSGNLPASTLTHMDAAPLEEVSTEEKLRAATDTALWNVKLTQDINLTAPLAMCGKGTINGNGHSISSIPATENFYDDGLTVKSGSQITMRELMLTGVSTPSLITDENCTVTLEHCGIIDSTQAIASVGKVILNDCTVNSPGGIHASTVMLERSVVNGMISAPALCITNSIVTGSLLSENVPGAVIANDLSIANSIVLGNYEICDGSASPFDMLSSTNKVIIDSVVGCIRENPFGAQDFSDIVMDSQINEDTPLSDVFTELTTVTEAGVSVTIPVVDNGKRGLEAVRLTDEWAEKLAAQPKPFLMVEGCHGEWGVDYYIYGIAVYSSVPYTAYFADEPLTDENYLEKGSTASYDFSLEYPGRRTVYYYILREGFPPEAGSTEIVVTKGTLEPIDVAGRGVAFDAVNSALTHVNSWYEYSVDGGATWTPCEDTWSDPFPISNVTFEHGISLRMAEDENFYASPAAVVPVEKQEKPVGVTVTQPSAAGDTGTISGVAADMEYSTDNGTSWTVGTGVSIENIPQGTIYLVRTKAAGNALPSDPIMVTVEKYGLTSAATPYAAIDYQNETLTGLSGDVLVDGTPYTVSGSLPIAESWFGKTINIVQRGDGSTTKDSEAQNLNIPARPAAPTVTATNETYPGAADGSITTDDTMEYRASTGEWISCTGEATSLAAGTYYVRLKATASTFASASTEVTVSSDPAQPEETPQAVVSADGNYLENLTANGTYAVNGAAYTADNDGKLEILRSWHGTTLQIVRKGNGASTLDSEAQYLTVPALAATHTVTYDLNSGTGDVKDEASYLPGDMVTVKFIPAPRRTGGAFLGWAESPDAETPTYTESGTKTFTMGEENVTLYAVWDMVKYTIIWDVDGVETVTQVVYGEMPVFNGTPTMEPTDTEEYSFVYWVPEVTPAVKDETYNAAFEVLPRTYTIALNANGGTVGSGDVVSYTYGTGAALPTDVVRSGCDFLGWFDNENCTGNPVASISTTDTGDKVYYAKWKINPAPSAVIDFENEKLTGLTASGNYKMNGMACTADESGKISIAAAWMGKTISIAAAGNGTNTVDSDPQSLKVSSRPAAPTRVTAEDETSTRNDGKILNVSTDMEYSKDGASWTPCTGTEATGLAGGSYKVRLKATASEFASEAVTVTVRTYHSGGSPSGTTTPDPDKPDTPDEPVTWENPYSDVNETSWYYAAVRFANGNGLFYGTSDTTFSPNDGMTRGMLATVLYRLEKEPGTTAEDLLNDVADGKYYTEAIAWAAENKIVAGYGNNRFGPEDSITREQLATILWRYAGSPESAGSLERFTDGSKTAEYAVPALQWAVEQGIVSGKGNGILDPRGQATRAEVAAMLMRYCETL